MKKILIYSSGYHARQIFRSQKKNFKILGFLDQDKKLNNKKIFKKYNIYEPYAHKIIDYDHILIAGFSKNQINNILKKYQFIKKKIIFLNKNQIMPTNNKIIKREKISLQLIRNFIKIIDDKYKYIFSHSSLLAILRKDNFAYYSDIDVLIKKEDFNKVYFLLKEKINRFNVTKYQKKHIKKIILSEKKILDNNDREIATLDIMTLVKNKNFYYFENFKNVKKKIHQKYFDKIKQHTYKNISFRIPLNVKHYMNFLYKKNWFKKPLGWNM